MRNQNRTDAVVLDRINREPSGAVGLFGLLLLVSMGLLVTACATPVPLHQFIDDLRTELTKTKEVTRLTITQVAAGQGDGLLRSEQNAQCSSDPILLFLGGELGFKLKATVGGELGGALTPTPAPTVKITGTGEHVLDWKVKPVSLGNLASVIFEGDIQTVQTIRNIEGPGAASPTPETTMIKTALLKEAWQLRQDLMKIANRLITNWQKPASCP